MTERRYWALIAILSVLLLVQVGERVMATAARANEPPDLSRVRVSPGTFMAAPIHAPNGDTASLGVVGKGRCTFAIIYSPTCGPSLRAAEAWHRMALAQGVDSLLPEDWVAVWVSVEDSATTGAALPPAFPFSQYYRATAGRIEPVVGVRAYPSHLILDRTGRLVSGAVGAPLPPADRFTNNCDLVSSSVAGSGR